MAGPTGARNLKPTPLLGFFENQKGGHAAFALGLAAIPRHRVVGPRFAPVRCPLRRPEEVRRAHEMRKRPGAIVADVADKTKLAALRQRARHGCNRRVLYEASFPVPPL